MPVTNQTAPHAAQETLAVILGGGRGTRLWPLTRDRAKPAVPVAGKFRLIDIPISNCINSGIDRIFVLTQFLSSSLNNHITRTYQFDAFRSRSFISLEAASQTVENSDWYQGTADAVRRTMNEIIQWNPSHVMILPGDTIFRMDLSRMIEFHEATAADVTIALNPAPEERAPGFGIVSLDDEDRIIKMTEKPAPENVPPLAASPRMRERWQMDDARPYLASMGIYVFRTRVLMDILSRSDMTDFGHHILPFAVENLNVFGYVFKGYWEDIGTIGAFFDVNLRLAEPDPPFLFHNADSPIYTRRRSLPSTRIDRATLRHSRLAEGCTLGDATLDRCMVGIRGIIGHGVTMRDTVMMGSDYYEWDVNRRRHEAAGDSEGLPPIGIGEGCELERAIIDKNARVGRQCRITSKQGQPDADDPEGRWHIRDGIVIVPKGAALPDGTVI